VSGGTPPVIIAPTPIATSAPPIVTVDMSTPIGPGTAASKDAAPNVPTGGRGKHTGQSDHPQPAVHGNGQASALGQPSAGAAQANAAGPGNGQANGLDQNNAGGQGNGNGQALDGDPGNGNADGNGNGIVNGNGKH
jgi:hypothetical protein